MTMLRFFIVGGVVLILSGVLQLVVRPRRPGENPILNRATVWAAFCMLCGLAAVLVGAGVVHIPGLPAGG